MLFFSYNTLLNKAKFILASLFSLRFINLGHPRGTTRNAKSRWCNRIFFVNEVTEKSEENLGGIFGKFPEYRAKIAIRTRFADDINRGET